MNRPPLAGHVIRRHTEESFEDLGRIIHVDEALRGYWWIPFQEKDIHKRRLKHFIKAPKFEEAADPKAEINREDVSLIPYVEDGLPRIPLATLKEMAESKLRPDRRNLKNSIAAMELQWSWIEHLVVGSSIETLLNEETVTAYALSTARAVQVDPRRIVRAVRAYLLGGCMKEALLPRWDRCNPPGKSKLPRTDANGIPLKRAGRKNIGVQNGYAHLAGIALGIGDREKLRKGWKKYKIGKQISVKQAYALTMAEFYGSEVDITAERKTVVLNPAGSIPTLQQFRRHGPGKDPALSAKRINLGAHRFARNERPLTGTTRAGLVAAAQCGQIDSTSDDQNLVSPADRTVRMPQSHNVKVIESYTGYILGVHSGFERPSTMTSLLAIAHAASDKVAFCARYGIEITEEQWLARQLRRVLADNGELKGEAGIETLTSSQASLEFAQAYGAELKGQVESSHHSLSRAGGHQLAGSTQGKSTNGETQTQAPTHASRTRSTWRPSSARSFATTTRSE